MADVLRAWARIRTAQAMRPRARKRRPASRRLNAVGTLGRPFMVSVRIPLGFLNTMNEQIARTAPVVPLAPFKQAAFGFLGGFLAIGVVSLLGDRTRSPLF